MKVNLAFFDALKNPIPPFLLPHVSISFFANLLCSEDTLLPRCVGQNAPKITGQALIAFFNLKKIIGLFCHLFPNRLKGNMEAQGATNISYVSPLLPPPHQNIISIFLKPIFHAPNQVHLKSPNFPTPQMVPDVQGSLALVSSFA